MRTAILLFTLLLASALACSPGEFEDINSQCQPCPSNQFSINGNGTVCQDCTDCTECQPTTGDCTACAAGFEPNGQTCDQCPSGQFSSGQGACQTCDQSCLTCDSTNGDCLTCESGKGLSGSTCANCNSDQFTNSNSFCQACHQSCQTCNGENANNCLSCQLDYGFVNNECTICPNGTTSDGTGPCQQCTTANCIQCTDNDICEECNSTYTLLDDKQCGYACSNLIANCSLCGPNDICAVCENGYTLDANSNTCNTTTNCTDFCEACSNDTTCAQCMSGYTLYNDTCLDNCGVQNCINCTNNVCEQCIDNYILFGSSTCIIQCSIDNCATCMPSEINLCETCNSGYTTSTDSSACVVCNVNNCNSCIKDNVCGSCMNNLQNMGGICISCQVDNCMICSSTNVCLTCYQGYSLNPDSGTTNANQCIACLDPCSTCFSDGSCKTCESPYSSITLTQGTSCFLCADPMCLECSDTNNGSCTLCPSTYTLVGGECQLICSSGCQTCSNGTVCNSCFDQFVFPDGNGCSLCTNAPACKTCSASDGTMCLSCQDGYWLTAQNQCVACPGYCRTCTSSTWCTALFNPTGFTLLYIEAGRNYPASCDPGCSYCSTVNPQECIQCLIGFYLTANNWCKSCTASSQCATCTTVDPAVCTSCMADAYLDQDQTCQPCTSPCSSCANMNATMCTSCIQGYVYIASDNTCEAEGDINNLFNVSPVDNCANSEITTDNQGANVMTCTLCLQGYTLTAGGCAPCPEGCQFCDPSSVITCLTCAPGFMLDSNNVCATVSGTTCPWGCNSCTELACFNCIQGLILNQNFQCQYPCMTPCATCQNNNPFSCITCLAGYVMTSNGCQPDTSCSGDEDCLICPLGTIINPNNTEFQINQVCTSCTSSSNCARCMSSNTAVCTSCSYGMYLNGTICSSCSTGCAACLTLSQCQKCAKGYVAQQPGTLQRSAATVGLVSCVACTSPCATCSGNPDLCTTCISGFNLQGQVCMSSFNYAVTAIFAVNLTTFMNNYLTSLKQIASSAGVGVTNLIVLSITSGSVVVNMQITSFSPAGSSAATTNQNNLNNLLASGNIGNMPVSSFTLTTNGGTNSNTDSGLSTTTIIILAVCIPGGILLIGLGIFLIYCYRKKRQERESTYAPQQGWSSGRSMSASRGVELMGYGTDRQRQQGRQAFL